MLDIDAAFDFVEELDKAGQTAVRLIAALYEEDLQATLLRAQKAEWLLERLHTWASNFGMAFDLSKAAKHWDETHEAPADDLTSRCFARLTRLGHELRELRGRLDEVLDAREQAEISAFALETERNMLRDEVLKLRGLVKAEPAK